MSKFNNVIQKYLKEQQISNNMDNGQNVVTQQKPPPDMLTLVMNAQAASGGDMDAKRFIQANAQHYVNIQKHPEFAKYQNDPTFKSNLPKVMDSIKSLLPQQETGEANQNAAKAGLTAAVKGTQPQLNTVKKNTISGVGL